MKLFWTFFFIFYGLGLATEIQEAPSVFVELHSGTKQNAKYLGFVQDTVILGGYIQNEYTEVKLHIQAFKSIKDSSGHELLLDLLKTKNPIPNDSNLINTDSSIQASSSQALFENKTLLLPFQTRQINAKLSQEILFLIQSLLQEQQVSTEMPSAHFFKDCKDMACIEGIAKENLASKLWTGAIIPTKSLDSLRISIKKKNLKDETLKQSLITVSAKTPFQDFLKSNEWKSLFWNIPPKKKSYIYIDTEPEGAFVSKKNEGVLCKSPCAFSTLDTGSISLDAYWSHDHYLLGGSKTSTIISGDTTKVFIKLNRMDPEIELVSIPLKAKIKIKDKDIGYTPKRIKNIEPGLQKIKLWKEGYQDTTLNVYVNVSEKTLVHVDLKPLTVLEEIEAQQTFIKKEKKVFWAKNLLAASVAPILTGAFFTYLSQKNYADAKKIKEDLQHPSIQEGENFQKMIQKNKDFVKKGDQKLYIGGASFITGAIMIGVGINLYF